MKLDQNMIALFLLLLASSAEQATGFVNPLLTVLPSRQKISVVVDVVVPPATGIPPPPSQRTTFVVLYGLLEDMKSGGSFLDPQQQEDNNTSSPPSEEDTSTTATTSVDESFETIFMELVFSAGSDKTQSLIQNHFEVCSNPAFTQWLETTKLAESQDDEERQALQELINLVQQVVVTQQQQQQQQEIQNLEEETNTNEPSSKEPSEEAVVVSSSSKMSNADILKMANQIDQAVVSKAAEAYEEEGPSDFMRDAKAERGLAGFNNRGQMRVGGN